MFEDKVHTADNGYGVQMVVSGGQTGVDLAAWDVAMAQGISIGGWVPAGRTNEAGRIPARYTGILEAPSCLPAERTFLNVKLADATLVVHPVGIASGGTTFTFNMAEALKRPRLRLDLLDLSTLAARQALDAWLRRVRPAKLNVAGPRASENGEIYQKTVDLLMSTPLGRAS
ncbi:MAG: putative molybdenum carrier protein [Bacteroidota bacterium]